MPNFKTRLKFYADTPSGQRNKLHCYSCDLFNIEAMIKRFTIKGYIIRAAFFETLSEDGATCISNVRVHNLEDIITSAYYELKLRTLIQIGKSHNPNYLH